MAQAKAYSEKLQIRFTFSTDGQGIYGIDMESGVEGEVARDPTPDELWNPTFAKQDRWREYFAAIPFEDRGGNFQGRYYQDIAIERVLEAIAAGDRANRRRAGERQPKCLRGHLEIQSAMNTTITGGFTAQQTAQ